MYANGNGVPQNATEAVKWYHLAAEQGSGEAQYNLGYHYGAGEGVKQDHTEATKWYRLAAKQGFPEAQHNLGNKYINGEGIPQNRIRAYVWWSVAAAQGFTDSVTNRDILADRLTPDELTKGQDIATRCFESDYQDCE